MTLTEIREGVARLTCGDGSIPDSLIEKELKAFHIETQIQLIEKLDDIAASLRILSSSK
jgi:hypothetical protein